MILPFKAHHTGARPNLPLPSMHSVKLRQTKRSLMTTTIHSCKAPYDSHGLSQLQQCFVVAAVAPAPHNVSVLLMSGSAECCLGLWHVYLQDEAPLAYNLHQFVQ